MIDLPGDSRINNEIDFKNENYTRPKPELTKIMSKTLIVIAKISL